MTSHVDALDTRPKCSGGCGKVMSGPEMICSSCPYPKPTRLKDEPEPELCLGCGEDHGVFGCIDAEDEAEENRMVGRQ